MKQKIIFPFLLLLVGPTVYFQSPLQANSSKITPKSEIAKPLIVCSAYPDWSASSTYNAQSIVVYNAHAWQARWWTQNDVPGGAANVWTDLGPCTSH